MHEIDEVPALNKKLKHDIDVVVDRIVVREGLGNRLADSLETALGLADGIVFVENADSHEQTVFSQKFACPVSGFTIPEIEPRLFSFNNPFGACPVCDGLGHESKIDPDLVVPEKSRTLKQGAIAPWAKSTSPYYGQTLDALARHYGFKLSVPWADLPEKVQDVILNGSGAETIRFVYDDGMRAYETSKTFEGIVTNLERRWRETESD